VECTSSSFWCCLSYASKGELVVGKLEGTAGQPLSVAFMKDGSFVFDVGSMTGEECTQF
jgi:hypothetical protein